MRIMIKFAFPVDAGNNANRTGKAEKVFQQIFEDLKPEAAYFFPEGGERAGLFVVDMKESSEVAEIAERFFFGLNARIEMVPVMAPEDLKMPGCRGSFNVTADS
jgi:predicted methyltransferase